MIVELRNLVNFIRSDNTKIKQGIALNTTTIKKFDIKNLITY